MRKKQMILLAVLVFLKMAVVEATPSQLFWTPCTTDVQDAGVFHLNINNYFDMSNSSHHRQSIPPDAGLRLGLFSWRDYAKGHNAGGMVGYERGFCTTKHYDGKEYKKWIFKADYASGENALGGGGIGIGYYFTPTILLVGGPTWVSNDKVNEKFKIGAQLQIDI